MSVSLHGNCPLMLGSSMATVHNHAVIKEKMDQHEKKMVQILETQQQIDENKIDDDQRSDSSPMPRQHGKAVIDKQDGTDGLWSRLIWKWI
jgi:hypothetical protein